MEQKLDLILSKLEHLEKDIIEIKNELNIIKSQTTKMDSHVDFVNNVYAKVEAPLNFVCEKFNSILGSTKETQELQEMQEPTMLISNS